MAPVSAALREATVEGDAAVPERQGRDAKRRGHGACQNFGGQTILCQAQPMRGDLLFQTTPAFPGEIAHRQALEAEGGIDAAQKTGRHPFLGQDLEAGEVPLIGRQVVPADLAEPRGRDSARQQEDRRIGRDPDSPALSRMTPLRQPAIRRSSAGGSARSIPSSTMTECGARIS